MASSNTAMASIAIVERKVSRPTASPLGLTLPPLTQLPLVTLYLTERCNSRCVSCDYWRHGRLDLSLDTVSGWLPSFAELGTRVVLISGGEPLLNPQWPEIARLLASQGLKLWLLSSGLSLAKHAAQLVRWFESVTVSLDGSCAETYEAIRGLDAFDAVCEGIRTAANLGLPVHVRVTVQRANYRELPRLVALARDCGAQGISFLAADVGNPHAFGRDLPGGFANDIALQPEDLPELQSTLDEMARDCAAEFSSGFIAENPQKLRRIHRYYAALCGQGEFPPVRCNAPEFSAVIEARGTLRPCFFIPGSTVPAGREIEQTLNSDELKTLRHEIRQQRRAECARCVCSMWRDPASVGTES